jgi:DNA polymerase III delta subunit
MHQTNIMLYLIYGTDTQKARAKVRALVGSLLEKKPDSVVRRLEGARLTTDALEEALVGRGLFATRYIVVLDMPSEHEAYEALVFARLKDLATSENIFIVLEGGVTKKALAKFDKVAEKVVVCERAEKEDHKAFNNFALADAFGARDKKRLWVLLQKALRSGIAPEELHGVLFWQMKMILLIKSGGTASALGMKPFVFNKAHGFAQKFSDEEARMIGKALVACYHTARKGEIAFENVLEEFVLSTV